VTDIDLIRRWQDGDESAFRTLYERYRRPLYAYLNRLAGGETHLADDLFQQVWLRAIDSFGRYREKDRFLSWLFRIAHNRATDHFRRRKVAAEEVLDYPVPDQTEPVADRIDQTTISKALEEAIRNLNPDQQEVLELRRNGVPFKKIAEIQDVSLNTVLGRMHYAVNHLRRALAPLRNSP
jgi:RNA polymerase sigma-70 factor (ECF subfamily)